MARILVSLSVVCISVLITVAFSACDVGSVVQNSTTTDGGGGSGSGSGSNCENISATPPDGHHVDGALPPGVTVPQATAIQGCMNAAGCHNSALGLGSGAPEYSYGGTLFTDALGTTPYAGATVEITLNGVTKKVITAGNGNFWLTPGIAGLEAPTNTNQGQTVATGCPTTLAMVGAIVQGGGNCNNCHRTGGTTTPMYLIPAP